MDETQWRDLRQHLVAQFRLGPHSAHDREHWERVEAYGLFIARGNGADLQVVRFFAWIHDSQRHQEGDDPEHGARAAAYARDHGLGLDADRLELLCLACRDHEKGYTSRNPTIGACWDSDRLDLDRVGVTPSPEFLSTAPGRDLARLRPLDRRKRARRG